MHVVNLGDQLLGGLEVLLAVISAELPHWVLHVFGELLLDLPEGPVLLQWAQER